MYCFLRIQNAMRCSTQSPHTAGQIDMPVLLPSECRNYLINKRDKLITTFHCFTIRKVTLRQLITTTARTERRARIMSNCMQCHLSARKVPTIANNSSRVSPVWITKFTGVTLNHGRLNAWDRQILRRMYGPVVEQAVWRIRRDQELWKLREDLDIVAHIKKKKNN